MATVPFRPPQFSDDVDWLPAWIQSNQAATPLNQLTEDSLHQSLQGMDPLKSDNNPVKDPKLQPSTESRYSVGQLYLSGDEITPLTLTPSCDKVLHFNLHFSTDGILSNISPSTAAISQYDKLYSAKSKPVQSDEALHGLQGTSRSNMEHNSSSLSLFPSSSDEKGSGNAHVGHNQTQCNGTSARQDILHVFNSKGTECDDINDAVELSIAASEALVIHELVQSGSLSETLSAAAILEVALQVKQARLDGPTASLYCSKNDSNSTDILSDLSDSEMEDAFKDVGLAVNNVDSILVKESSISRVKDTPMSEFYLGEEREVQSEQQRDQEICFSSNFGTKPLEENLDGNTSNALLTEILDTSKQEMGTIRTRDLILGSACGSQTKNLDDLRITQEADSNIVNADRFAQQLKVKSSPVVKSNEFTSTMQHSHCVDMDKVNDKSASRFQSRWFGGWVGKEEGDAREMESKVTKTIRKLFAAETSYLSESADVAPDQNSFVHNNHRCSKASESSIPLEGSCGTTGEEGLVAHDIVKDSCNDPLCSIVPCSISAEINDSPHTTGNNDNTRALDAITSQKTDSEIPDIPWGNVQINSHDDGENVGRQNLDELVVNAIGPSTIINRQLTSLRPYSVGLPGNSLTSLKRAFKCSLASPGKNSASLRFGKREINSTKCHGETDLMKLPPVTSTSDCATVRSDDKNQEIRLLSKGEHVSCTNTLHEKVPRKQPFGSLSCCTPINNENHKTYGFANASGRLTHDDFEQNAENGGQVLVQLQEIQRSPLVLSRRTRHRFKAPKLPVTEFSTANQMEDQGPGYDVIYQKHREVAQDLDKKLPDSEHEISARKRVRFAEIDIKMRPEKSLKKILSSGEIRSSCRARDRTDLFEQELGTASQEVKERLTNCRIKGRKRTIFRGLEFLLTGFSKKKEREIEVLLRKHGGMILSDIPSPPPRSRGKSLKFDAQRLPVILCTKKLQTTTFLYGCAVNAFLLKVAWAYDSIKAGSVLLPDKYIISFNQTGRNLNPIGQSLCQNNDSYIFDKVGIILHGRNSFCSKLAKVIKHGRGHVYRSLHWLVQSLESKKISLGVVVTEDENRATRHLKKCAAEQKIPMVPARWMIRSLFEGKLLPFDDQNHRFSRSSVTDDPTGSARQDCSQEI